MPALYVRLPLLFLKFWFIDAPRAQLLFFTSLNQAFLQLFSLRLLVRTYFKPWKNEYREGLVGFAVGMGLFIKTIVIIADIVLLFLLILLELLVVCFWILWPVTTVLWIIL